MKLRVITTVSFVVAAALMGGLAQAKRPASTSTPALWSFACSSTDLTLPASASVDACQGFFEGNLLGGSADKSAAVAAALVPLGVATYSTWIEKLDLNQSTSVDFAHRLYGDTVVGVHFGAGAWNDPKPSGGATAFYRFDAGTDGIDLFGLNLSSSSGATLFKTGAPPAVANPVPEPSTYALLLAGLGAVGFVARRRAAA